MNITDYILKEIKSLTPKSTVEKAQKLFNDYPITHFNVVENGIFLGSFSESDIQTIENKTALLSEYNHLLTYFFADEKTTVLALLQIFADNDATVIPVLDPTKKYLGYYDLCDVLGVFASSPFMNEESETLVIETVENNFSMPRISQIVEASGGKLLGCYISEKKAGSVQVTLKVVTQKITEIIQTFRRYEYIIVSSHENDSYLDDLKNRSQYLQKYLNI